MLVLAAAVVSGWLGFGFTWHSTATEHWIYVRRIAPGSPAAAAGIEPQDVITHIDGKPVAFKNDLDAVNFFKSIRVGQKVVFTVLHNQQKKRITLTAAPPPDGSAERWQRNVGLAHQRSGRE